MSCFCCCIIRCWSSYFDNFKTGFTAETWNSWLCLISTMVLEAFSYLFNLLFYNFNNFFIYFSSEVPGQFYLSHHLMNQDKEINYLRKISELFVVSFFSKAVVSHTCNKNLLIEIFTCKGKLLTHTYTFIRTLYFYLNLQCSLYYFLYKKTSLVIQLDVGLALSNNSIFSGKLYQKSLLIMWKKCLDEVEV